MISEAQFQKELELIISNAIREDVGDGDHSSLACIPASAQGKAKLLVKDEGIIAGVEFAKMIFHYVDKGHPRIELIGHIDGKFSQRVCVPVEIHRNNDSSNTFHDTLLAC